MEKQCHKFVNDFYGLEEIVEASTMKVASISKQLCLEMEFDDVKDQLSSHREGLSAKDLIQLRTKKKKLTRRMNDEDNDPDTARYGMVSQWS